jgi:hypothetical protein
MLALLIALVSCSKDMPAPTGVGARDTPSPALQSGTATVAVTVTATPAAALATLAPAGVATPMTPGTASTAATAAPQPEVPPDGISRNEWAQARVRAAAAIWGISQAGRSWLESYDFRQMLGQPAWFGSYGNKGWAGGGEAVPRIIIHELSHSYWGAFPVSGRPDLSFDDRGAGPSAALAQYRADLETFMRQPPDRYEPLRDRFRNMPGLTSGDYPDLFHSGEADIIQFTGGHISLLPPILLKYYDAYMTADGVAEGPLPDWAAAVSWWRGLSDADQRAASDVFGLQHFPLSAYPLPAAPGAALRPGVRPTLEGEERQRLADFASQFDLIKSREFALVDAAGVNRGFSFWKGYLSDMKELHRSHPEVLNAQEPRAAALGSALDYYISIERLSPQSQVESFRRRGPDTATTELAVLLKSRAVIDLFAGTPGAAPEGGTISGVEGVIGFYARELARTAVRVDAILAAATRSAAEGAAALEEYLGSLSDSEVRSDTGLIFDLMREADPEGTRRVLKGLSDGALLRLLSLQPAAARSGDIGPGRLLAAAGITPGSGEASLTAGARLLAQTSSGNFQIDLPYEMAVFDAVERLGRSDPAAALRVVADSGLRITPWLDRGSTEMLGVLSSAPDSAAALLLRPTGLHTSPARAVHALTGLDPDLAADLVAAMARQGWSDAGMRSVLELAHDAYWHGLNSGPGISPSLDARFVARLRSLMGDEWVMSAVADAMSWAKRSAAAGEVATDFEMQLRRTLAESAAAAPDGATKALLQRLAAAG